MKEDEEWTDEITISDLPEWAFLYWTAWHELQFDRFVGAMGGQGPIYYTAISHWARDNRLSSDALAILKTTVRGMDEVYLGVMAKKSKEEDEKRKAKEKGRGQS